MKKLVFHFHCFALLCILGISHNVEATVPALQSRVDACLSFVSGGVTLSDDSEGAFNKTLAFVNQTPGAIASISIDLVSSEYVPQQIESNVVPTQQGFGLAMSRMQYLQFRLASQLKDAVPRGLSMGISLGRPGCEATIRVWYMHPLNVCKQSNGCRFVCNRSGCTEP